MAEESRPWPGTTVGDAGPYSDDDWDDIWGILFGSEAAPYNDRGVIRNWENELEVTDASPNAVDVDTGAALVHGKFYRNTAVVNVAVPSSSGPGNWREDLICLQSSWVAQTIRIARHANPGENVGYPAPTQTDGVTWEIPLAAVRINDVGTITLITDLRDWVNVIQAAKELFVPPRLPDDSLATMGYTGVHIHCILQTGLSCYHEFVVPPDFKKFVQAIVIVSAFVDCTIDWRLDTEWGNCDEVYNIHTDTASGADLAVVQDTFKCIDVSAAFNAAPFVPGDVVGCMFTLVKSVPVGTRREFMLLWRYR